MVHLLAFSTGSPYSEVGRGIYISRGKQVRFGLGSSFIDSFECNFRMRKLAGQHMLTRIGSKSNNPIFPVSNPQLPVASCQLPTLSSHLLLLFLPWFWIRLSTQFFIPPPSRWVYTYFLCAQRKLIWLVARWLLPVQWRAGKVGLKNPLTGSDISGASSVRQPFFYEWKIALSLCLALPRLPSLSAGGSYKLIE